MKTAAILVSLLAIADAYTSGAFGTRRSTMTMKRAGGSGKKLKQALETSKKGGMGSSSASSSSAGFSRNWISMPTENWNLSKLKEDKVELFDTNLVTLKDSMTNPTGAVSVLKHKGQTFCFGSSCPSCKIPLSGAKVLPVTSSRPSPLLACNFCKSAFDLKTGQKSQVSAEEAGGGLFAGLAQSVFKASNNNDPLKTYQLGEKDGKILIALD